LGITQCGVGGLQRQPLLDKRWIVEVASRSDPCVRKSHGLTPELGRAPHIGRLHLVDVAVEADQCGDQVLLGDLRIMLMLSMGVPPSHLQLGSNSRIAAQPAGLLRHSEEPCHVSPGGFWVIVWIRRPCLAPTQDVPSRLQISEWSQRKAVPNHPEQSRQHARPVAVVVPNPRLTLTATDRDRIDGELLTLRQHGPIIPHQMGPKEDLEYA
jgi:hypothetical protein